MPVELPKDAHALAVHAIKQITSKDPTTDVKTYDKDEENLDNDTWVVSGMSPKQIELLSKWPAVSTYYYLKSKYFSVIKKTFLCLYFFRKVLFLWMEDIVSG